MSSDIEADVNGFDTAEGATPMFRLKEQHRKYKTDTVIKDRHVYGEPGSKAFAPSPAAILEPLVSDDEKDEDPPVFITCSDEVDIGKRLKRPGQVTDITLGLGWRNGEKCPSFLVRDCIIQWRANVGQKGNNQTIDGRDSVYGATFLMVGIPVERFAWIASSLAFYGIEADVEERRNYLETDGEHAWLTCNMMRNHSLLVSFVDTRGEVKTHDSLVWVLQSAKKSIKGIFGFNMSLRRSRTSPGKYSFYIAPMFFQITDVTDALGPQVLPQVKYLKSISKKDVASRAVQDLFGTGPPRSGGAPRPGSSPHGPSATGTSTPAPHTKAQDWMRQDRSARGSGTTTPNPGREDMSTQDSDTKVNTGDDYEE